MLRYYSKILLTMFSSIILFGCTVTSGLNSGKIPTEGNFTADNGVNFFVQELNANNIPYVAPSKPPMAIPRHLFRSANQYAYGIAKGDVLGIVLPSYPEVTQQLPSDSGNLYASGYLVDQQGFIQFPLVGRIQVVGMTTTQVSSLLTQKLLRYLKYPDPQVRILAYRGSKFYIDGQVKSPGQYNLADQPVSLYGAIGMAGGNLPTSDSENISLIRNGKTYRVGLKSIQKSGLSPHNFLIQNGDSIHVGTINDNKIYVVGEFGKPNPIVIPENGISLSGVLGEASGLNSSTANAAKIYVLREHVGRNTASIYYLNLRTLTNFSLANRFNMQANDVVYVDPTGLTRWNRVVSLLLPSASLTNVAKGF